MLAGIETAARRSCEVNPNLSSLGKLSVAGKQRRQNQRLSSKHQAFHVDAYSSSQRRVESGP